ncbi:kunitz-type protease inhibitor 1 [Oryzias melastigma]|uniref:Kunitz-type protease inhibitor 1-like n=1 Tax=Oryzias melastigma TaxID=30732 RepID=A0A3B3C3M1_ORYME|nr:kunitz-type protease inhibitor 1 [Oryzias melastigma]
MSRSGSSSLLLLLLLLAGGASEECSDLFRRGKDNFVLDTAEAVKNGAAPLASERTASIQECEGLCCGDERCNLALLVPADPADEDQSPVCALFDCVYRNKFVCDFTTQEGYKSSIRTSVYEKYLPGPDKMDPPIAKSGGNIITQPGRPVLLSGIASLVLLEDHIIKYQWSFQEGNNDVVIEKTDQPDELKLTNLKEGIYTFQLTITDAHRKTSSGNVSVLVITPEMSKSYCLAPLKVGPCRASFPRWQYNATLGVCTEFHFGGCNANDNNYLSNDDCMSACQGVPDTMQRIILPSEDMNDCNKTLDGEPCVKLNRTFNRLLRINLSERRIQCTDAPRTGPCRASIPRWYYDPLKQMCTQFTFGGCSGNDNNFDDESTCMETCDGVSEKDLYFDTIFSALEEDEEDGKNSGSAVLTVVLILGLIAVLAGLSYLYFKKRRNQSSSPVSTDPATEVLSTKPS